MLEASVSRALTEPNLFLPCLVQILSPHTACTHGSLSNLSCAQYKCSSAAVFTRVSLVTLQSVHAARSLQKLQNCITASILHTELRISPNVRSYDCVVLVIELSLRPMSRCLVNTEVIATPAIITRVSAALL